MELPHEIIDMIYNKADTDTQNKIKKTSKYFYTTKEYNEPFLLQVYDFNLDSDSYNETDDSDDEIEERRSNCSKCCNCERYIIGAIKFKSLQEMIKFVSEKIDRHYENQYDTIRVEYRMYQYTKECWKHITTINDYFDR